MLVVDFIGEARTRVILSRGFTHLSQTREFRQAFLQPFPLQQHLPRRGFDPITADQKRARDGLSPFEMHRDRVLRLVDPLQLPPFPDIDPKVLHHPLQFQIQLRALDAQPRRAVLLLERRRDIRLAENLAAGRRVYEGLQVDRVAPDVVEDPD